MNVFLAVQKCSTGSFLTSNSGSNPSLLLWVQYSLGPGISLLFSPLLMGKRVRIVQKILAWGRTGGGTYHLDTHNIGQISLKRPRLTVRESLNYGPAASQERRETLNVGEQGVFSRYSKNTRPKEVTFSTLSECQPGI